MNKLYIHVQGNMFKIGGQNDRYVLFVVFLIKYLDNRYSSHVYELDSSY